MKKSLFFLIAFVVSKNLISFSCFGQQTAYDDFERHLLGPNWTDFFSGNANIVDSSDLGFPTSGYFAIAGYTAVTFPANQYSEIMISPDKIDSMLVQVFVRRRSSDNARYGFHWNPSYGGRWEIKYDGVPSAQTRILDSMIAPVPLNGDTLRLEIQGMTLRGYHNGIIVVQATDTAFSASNPITTTGVPGVAFRFNSTGFPASYPSPVVEEWNGGELIATSVTHNDYEDSFFIYPNPASDRLNVYGKNILAVEIFSTDGKRILFSKQKTVDISSLASGLYFLKFYTGTNHSMRRFTVLTR